MIQHITINAQDLNQISPSQGLIIDVRSPMEHAEKRIGFKHVLVPLEDLKAKEFMMRHGLDADAEIYILCRSGNRAKQAADKFILEGYTNVKIIDGGLISCESCGHEIKGSLAHNSKVTIKNPLSLERQVRIAAGSIIVIGSFLALAFNYLLTIIPLFVGCGLVYAGLSDRCGMALILTKAPWNK